MKNEILSDPSRERIPSKMRSNWSIRVPEVGGKFEIKGAQRPDFGKFIHRCRSKLTHEPMGEEIERGGNRPWNGRWSRCALPYAKHWPPWSDCIHTFQYIHKGRARNWLEDPRLLLPCFWFHSPAPVSFSRASGPIRLFLEYPTKWGQVLRRICGIDGNPTYLREDGISTRG